MHATDTQNSETVTERIEGGRPDMEQVIQDWETTKLAFGDYSDLQASNWNTRHCRWPGQTKDQKKHARVVNGTTLSPFPWDGASDLKVPIIDENVNYAVALDMLALKKANIRAQPVGIDSLGKATMATNFMRWLMSQITELRDESELISQVRHVGGLSVLKVYWEKKIRRINKDTTLEEMSAAMPELAQAIAMPELEGECARLLVQLFSGQEIPVKLSRAKKMVRELREEGRTTVPAVDGADERTRLKALTPGEDIFFPPNTMEIQAASAIYERVLLTPASSRAKIATDGWDEDYTNYAADHCATTQPKLGSDGLEIGSARSMHQEIGDSHSTGLVEWIYAYQRRTDENGVPGVYLTIFCPEAKTYSAPDACAYSELLNYRDGEYPHVAFKRERLSRCLLDSRGLSEVGHAWQQAIKVELDMRIDTSSLATLPPRYSPYGRPTTAWGPGAEVQVRREGEYGYIGGPGFPNNSVEVTTALERMVRSFFGRPTSDLDQSESQTKLQKQIDDFLSPWREVMRKVWSLYKQFGKDEEFFRVLGVPAEQAQKFSKAEFSEKYDFFPSFDVLEQDPETYAKKLEQVGPIMAQWDSQGQIDREQMLIVFLSYVFGSTVAERLVLPKDTAANKEIKETHEDLAQMWSGVDKDPPLNTAAELRLQTMQQWQQGSQDNPALDVQQRLQSDQAFRTRIDKYVKQLQFQIEQRKNAQIGRQGAKPAYS